MIYYVLYFSLRGAIEALIAKRDVKKMYKYYHLLRLIESVLLLLLLFNSHGAVISNFFLGLFFYEVALNIAQFKSVVPTRGFYYSFLGHLYIVYPWMKVLLMALYFVMYLLWR